MSSQPDLQINDTFESFKENPVFLTYQLITYIGNKRTMQDFLGNGLKIVQNRLGKAKLDTFDVFSGSGVVSRYLKQYSRLLITNDLEKYASVINQCYLTNENSFDHFQFRKIYSDIIRKLENEPLHSGFITEMYAPLDDKNIKKGERVFYTTRNAKYLDTARTLIDDAPEEYKKYLLAPLLSEASIHANTSGVFKGFYKNSDTGIGRFGGKNEDALYRITGGIKIPYPVFSNFNCDFHVFTGDSNLVCENLPEVDVAYLDPPYNQHPYGSNYFMLNALLDYKKPEAVSTVSGIPVDWNRSAYNRNNFAYNALSELVNKLNAKYLLISFNSEGFVPLGQMTEMLEKYGRLTVLETKYNTFRGSRNLFGRDIHVKEYLYLLEKS